MKLFKNIALILTSLLALSCSKEAQPEHTDEMLTVQYGVSVDAATKSLGDGETANYVWYALYRSTGSLVSECSMPAKIDADGHAICPVTMAKGQNYKIVFVAMYYDIDEDTKTPAYNIDPQNAILYMPESAVANSDKYDLFCGLDVVTDFQGNQNTNVTLFRKVAQVNFELSDSAWDNLNIASTAECMSSMTISEVPSSLNLMTAELSEVTTSVSYAKSTVQTETERKMIGTAYCLAPTGNQPQLNVNASVKFYRNSSDTEPISATATSVQVEANKKTNLIIN